ncbi:hypothetical protein GHT06_006389 [Daphnia sinensis]|uniref:Uncharacterized protein n=1 Tax=Daphnia sinensis TaxID=1820382 RepID=A0AAD5KWD9_9CRUS|nr:hypothetical protein GHT06_006389 [Daphnia sinensis]
MDPSNNFLNIFSRRLCLLSLLIIPFFCHLNALNVTICNCTASQPKGFLKFTNDDCDYQISPLPSIPVYYDVYSTLPQITRFVGHSCTMWLEKKHIYTDFWGWQTPSQSRVPIEWSFERVPNVQGSWLQVTADQLINCRLEEVTLETECANCTISSPIGDIPGGINGSVSHNLVTIVWKESLREIQQCKLRLVETGIAQRYLTNNSEIERIRDIEQQLDFVYNTTNQKYLAREIRALQCENRLLAHKTAIATAQHSGWLAASYLNLPICSKLIATGESVSVYQCSPTNSTITTEITSCGPQPKLGDYTLDTEGWELTPYNPCYWHKNYVNINGRAYFYKNSSWHPIVPGVIIQGHSLINTLPYEIDKLLALSLHPALTPHPMSTSAAIAEIIAAAKEEHSIDLGNPFHLSTLLSTLRKEENVSLSSKIFSWSSSICSLLGMGFIGFVVFHFCGIGSLIARYIPCCSFLSACNPFTCFTKTSENNIEVGHPTSSNPPNQSPPITIVNVPTSNQQPAPEFFAPSAPFLQGEPQRNKFHRDALRQAHREAAVLLN